MSARAAEVPSRWLVVRGRRTALRWALPTFGVIRVGRLPNNDLCLDEPEVAGEHAIISLSPHIELEVRADDTELTLSDGTARLLPSGARARLEPGDRARLGGVELEFLAERPAVSTLRLWSRRALEEHLAAAPDFAVIWLEAPGAAEALAELLPAGAFAARAGEGAHLVVFSGARVAAAQAVARALGARLGGAGVGLATRAEGPARAAINLAAERSAGGGGRGEALVAVDPETAALLAQAEEAGASDSPVLILGETGTGKDLLAQFIHRRSSRAVQPLVHVHGAELPESALEEALSGDELRGPLGRAQGGTLVLDEVAALSPRAQLVLGRLIERWAAGASPRPSESSFRLITTATQDPRRLVREGALKKELLFRLNRVQLTVPPLRDRPGDLLPLAERLIARAAAAVKRERAPALSPQALARLSSHPWPGNVRELEAVLERAVRRVKGALITADDLDLEPVSEPTFPPEGEDEGQPVREASGGGKSLRDELAELERRRIQEALERYPTQAEAAKALDIPLRTFLNRLDALGIERPRKK